ncbi:glycosyltransferase family 2 protein [Bacillus sp. Bva_UNVM-123]|uniref:glycosyltransferase family A protein n=1 Tax=Bacillus sp. Bva_UNVM-123 TaxID=2829798 RepID=UPI00391F8175
MNSAFVTFVYPRAKRFFNNFIKSIESQSVKKFKLILFNDGCSTEELKLFHLSGLDIHIEENNCSSIAQNRLKAIDWLYESNYDFIIFGDIDDTFAHNRVEVLMETLKKHPIVINELHLINHKNKVIQRNLVETYLYKKKVINKSMIRECNLIGFSHLAVHKKTLNVLRNIYIDENLKIVDWLFASYLLIDTNAFFENRTFTNYVLHENNIGLNDEDSIETYMFILDTKIIQYSHITDFDAWYSKELKRLEKLKLNIENDLRVAKRFQSYMNKQKKIYYPWWTQIKNSEELESEIYF